MAELYIFDKDDKFITVLSEDTGLVSTWFKDYENNIPDEPFTFFVDVKSELLHYILEENQVAFYDRDNDIRLMRIKEIYEETTNSSSIRVKCEPSWLELYDHFVEERRVVEGTAQTALNRVLEGSRYIGEVTVELGLGTESFYWIDGVESVFKIISTWGGKIKDTITLNDNNEIIERKLWILQRLGADNGLIVEPDYNAEQINRNTLSYPETALWGQGSSLQIEDQDGELTGGYTRYITFEDVEWKVTEGDPVDKPLGQKWVGDPIALQQHGYLHDGKRKHRFGHFSNQDYEIPEELLWATWQELQERKLKEIIHEANIYETDKKVSLGDTATIIDRRYNKPIELQSQITGLEYDILKTEEVKIVVGKFIDMNDDLLQREVDDLKDQVRKRPRAQVTENSYPDVKPPIPPNVRAVGGFEVIQLYWDYADELFIKHYEVYGSQVADSVPDSQHLLWRGQLSAFAHAVNTDETWYYYVRAVNYHGTPSDWSVRVSASTTRIISDDILFGEIIADHLADNLDIADKLAQNTIDRINAGPMKAIQYTQEEIEATETRILADLDNRIGDVNANISDLINRADSIDGTITTINQEVDDLEGRLNITINQLTNIDGVVSDHTLTLNALPGQLNAKAEKTEVYTKTQTDNLLDDKVEYTVYSNKVGELTTSINNVSARVTNTETNINSLTGDMTDALSQIGELDVRANAVDISVSEIKTGLNDVGKWNKDYNANTVNHSLLRDSNDGPLDDLYSYEVTAKTLGTSTDTTAIAVFKSNRVGSGNAGAGWTLEKIYEKGNFSNHPEFFIDSNGNPSIRVYNHTTTYRIRVQHVKLLGRESSISTAMASITTLAGQVEAKASQTIVDGLTGDMTAMESRLNLLPDEIDLAVSEGISGIEIGGRNFITDSEELKWNAGTSSSSYQIVYRGLERNQTYTVSFDAELTGTGNTSFVTVYPYLRAGESMSTLHIPYTSGKRMKQTFTTDGRYDYNLLIYAGRSGSTSGNSITLRNLKLEKGNKSTDWTPAPEDQVSKTNVLASINLSSEGVRIDGDVVHITGQTLIDDAVIGTAAIADAAISRLKLGTGVVGTLQIEDAAITDAKIRSVSADKVSAASLDVISGNMGTLRSGRLLSNNNNMDLNLNTGSLRMSNVDFILGGGANIVFEDAGNKIKYTRFDSEQLFNRTSGFGVGNVIGGRYPFAYVGTDTGTNLDTLSVDFTGLQVFTAGQINTGAATNISSHRFELRNRANGWDRGLTFDWFGTPNITPMVNGTHDMGTPGFRFRRLHVNEIRGSGNVQIRDAYGLGGWQISTDWSSGENLYIGGLNTGSYNYNIGRSTNYLTYAYVNSVHANYLRGELQGSSARKFKKNEDVMNLNDSLEFIRNAEIVTFDWIRDESTKFNKDNPQTLYDRQVGFILDDLKMENDYLVKSAEDTIKKDNIIFMHQQVIQHHDKQLLTIYDEISRLKTENQLQANEIKILKNRVEKLEELVA